MIIVSLDEWVYFNNFAGDDFAETAREYVYDGTVKGDFRVVLDKHWEIARFWWDLFVYA